jgi:hypothetical protein
MTEVRTESAGARLASSFGALLSVVIVLLCLSQASTLDAQPTTNRVLELDGNGSYVELPPDAFTNLMEFTIEGWVKWKRFARMSRFFDFTMANRSINARNQDNEVEYSVLGLVELRSDKQLTILKPFGLLPLRRWVHLAAVSGKDELKILVNGEVVSTSASYYAFVGAGLENWNYLGRSNRGRTHTDADFCGQIDEVRVWRVARTKEQIRDNMLKVLTGKERDLVGLWNFDDGTARDATTNGLDGRLIGNAKTVVEQLPPPAEPSFRPFSDVEIWMAIAQRAGAGDEEAVMTAKQLPLPRDLATVFFKRSSALMWLTMALLMPIGLFHAARFILRPRIRISLYQAIFVLFATAMIL